MKKYLFLSTLSLFLCVAFSVNAASFIPGGNLVAPTVYRLTVQKIEFRNTSGEIATFYTGSYPIDIAAANPGESIGAIQQNGSLELGTYNSIRITLSRTFAISASIADIGGGVPCRTSSANATTSITVPFALNNVPRGAVDGGAAQIQSIAIPLDATIETALASEGYTFVGENIQSSFVGISPFTVDEIGTLPSTQIDFDVANSVELSSIGVGVCAIIPQAPGIDVSVVAP